MAIIGKLVTSVATKFGLCTRKAAMRIATETGQKLVDESTRLGRNLNLQEIESVFKQCVPKKIRPKILVSQEEAAKDMLKRGASQETIDEFLGNPYLAGIAMTMGRKKASIFLNSDCNIIKLLSETTGMNPSAFHNSMIAHELEHALEYNGRFRKILERKIIDPIKLALKKDKTAYIKQINKDNLEFQMTLQERGAESYFDNPKSLGDTIKSLVQELSNGSKRKIRLYKRVLNLETPAYITGNNVEKYGIKDPDLPLIQGITADVYKKAGEVLKNI